MIDLATRYLGLELKNPLVVASCGLTTTLQGVQNCAAAGAGAIVLKSLFEEQIELDVAALLEESPSDQHSEAQEYLEQYGQAFGSRQYIDLVHDAKKAVEIPIIASINCATSERWADYAAKLALAGADALEVNVGFLPNSTVMTGATVEDRYQRILQTVKAQVDIPVALKVGPYFSSFGQLAHQLGQGPQGADALVLFNRFYRLDIDIDSMQVVAGNPYSSPEEIHYALRWIMLLAGNIDCDLAATTGIHSGRDVVKQLLAGATVTQLCSTIYQHGFVQISRILEQLSEWMKKNGYRRLEEFRGRLSQRLSDDQESYERLQYIKGLTGIE